MMPVVGWLAGESLAGQVGGYSDWLAFVLLAFVGGKMLWEARGRRRRATATPPAA